MKAATLVTSENVAARLLSRATSIYVSSCAAEIGIVRDLLRQHAPDNATITGIFSPLVNTVSYADPEKRQRVRTFFLSRELKRDLALGLVDFCPWRYLEIDRYLSRVARFDTALVMLSPPDRMGRCSLGLQTDFLPGFLDRVEHVIGFINPQMPHTRGAPLLDYHSLATTIDFDCPLVEARSRKPDPVAQAIAAHIAALVRDGDTIQLGLGQIPSAVVSLLQGHRNLSVHSGLVDTQILGLEQSGALNRDQKIVTGTAIGMQSLYAYIGASDRFSFRPVSYTHAVETLARFESFTAVNSVLQVDLFGQASAEYSGGRLIASPGGLPDFVRGALAGGNGRSILAVRARGMSGQSNGIAASLDKPHKITIPSVDADIVVTEYGVARIRDLSLDQRAEALIAIADPADQQQLAACWSDLRKGST